jgi:hypothetical protein
MRSGQVDRILLSDTLVLSKARFGSSHREQSLERRGGRHRE